MAASKPYFFKEGSFTIGGTDYGAQAKNVEISMGERDSETIQTMGTSYHDIKPMGEGEITFDAVGLDQSFVSLVHGGTLGGTEGSAVGDSLSCVTNRAIVLDFFDDCNVSGAQLQFNLTSGVPVSVNWSADTDGHLEESVTVKFLPKDFIVYSTDDRATTPISGL